MQYLLGTDIGTSGTKTILTDLNGTLIANPSAKNPYEIYEKSLSSGTHQCAYIVTAKETWSGFTAFYHYAACINSSSI